MSSKFDEYDASSLSSVMGDGIDLMALSPPRHTLRRQKAVSTPTSFFLMFFSSLPPEPIPHPHRAERAINWDIMKGWGERGGKERGDSKWEEGEKRTFFHIITRGGGEDRERLQNKGEGERKEANGSRMTNIFEQRHFLNDHLSPIPRWAWVSPPPCS